MIRLKRFLYWLGLVMTFWIVPAGAQWQLSLDTYTGQENNLLRYYNPVSDVIFSPQFEIAWLGTESRLFYNYNLTQLSENKEYNYSVQQVGIDFIAGNDMGLSHYLVANFNLRRDEPDYSYFDYWKAEGVYNCEYFPASWAFLKGELAILYKNFDEEPAWNHLETNLNLSGSLFLPTRTTIRLSLSGLLRDFISYKIPGTDSEIAELSSLWQLVSIARLAQSFGDKLGGYSEFLYRYNPSGGNPYQMEITAFSPIDDYFGYKGYRWTNSLKWKINPRFWTKIVIATFDNTYLNRPVYAFDFENETWPTDADGEYILLAENRRDYGYTAGISTGLKLQKIFDQAANLEIIGFFEYFRNCSNDEYFEYDDRSFGLQIRYDFQW